MIKRNVLFSLVGAAALFLLLFAIGTHYFGGIGQFLAFVNGQPLYLLPRQIDLGSHEPGTELPAVFKLTNLASKEISVVGARTSCDCALPEGIPIAVPPGKTIDLDIKVRLPKYESSYDQTIIFMIAEPNKLGMHPVRITATIPIPLPRPVADKSEPAEDETTLE